MIALSGGSTPKLLYQKLVSLPETRQLLAQRAEFYFSDERPVGPEHPESNFHSADSALFRPLGIDRNHVHRMRGEAEDSEQEAAIYGQEIRATVPIVDNWPRFDVTLLGMGADGHIASLFPDFAFDPPSERLILAPFVRDKGTNRLTFSLPMINASHAVFLMVTGSDKADTVRKALYPQGSGAIVPAARVDALETRWFLDRDAAARLDKKDIRVKPWPTS